MCVTPRILEAIACLAFEWLSFRAQILKNCYIIKQIKSRVKNTLKLTLDKMHIEKKQEVWWVYSLMIVYCMVVIFYKAQE